VAQGESPEFKPQYWGGKEKFNCISPWLPLALHFSPITPWTFFQWLPPSHLIFDFVITQIPPTSRLIYSSTLHLTVTSLLSCCCFKLTGTSGLTLVSPSPSLFLPPLSNVPIHCHLTWLWIFSSYPSSKTPTQQVSDYKFIITHEALSWKKILDERAGGWLKV
jgi:hypothetical protein